MILSSSRDSQVCMYDFDNSGGAQGLYRLGLFIDSNSYIDLLAFQPLIACTSGGLATISFGVITNVGTSIPTALTAATAFGGPFIFSGAIFIGLPVEITMTIAVADLTAGKIMVLSEYFNTDF